MSYFIVAVVFTIIGFAGCFLIYRNNMTKIGKIDDVLTKGEFNLDKVRQIEAIIKGTDCKDCE